jgi:predicted nucleic acid-binding protein
MKYVIDASAAVKWALTEVDSDNALRLRDDFRTAVHELLSTDFFPYEVAHALTRAERQKRIAVGDAWSLWKAVLADCPALSSGFPLMQRAVEISSQMRIGIYDCLYVALAEREACECVTADDKLIKNLQPTFPFIIGLSSLP